MELIFSMRRKPLKYEPPNFGNVSHTDTVRPLCTVSVCNIIAFSSPTELSDTDGDTWGGHVYVCDLDTPWDSYKVTSTVDAVSAIEWDSEGKNLLVATVAGSVSVYGQKEYLLNEWTCLYSANFPGEHIIKSTFFHNGRRIMMLDKKPETPITDRIQLVRSTPTLKGFGGSACSGAVVMTSSGLVGCVTPGERAHLAADCLRPVREHVTNASFAHKNGNILVAAVCRRGGRGCVRVLLCSAARGPPPTLTLQPLPAVTVDDLVPPVTVSWCMRDDVDSLLISGSTLTMWKLTERSLPVHKMLNKGPVQGSATTGAGGQKSAECYNTLVWQQTAAWQTERCVSLAACSSAPHVVVAAPRALHLLARDNHHYICSVPVITNGRSDGSSATPPKKPKYGHSNAVPPVVCSISVCALGGACVVVDSRAQLHAYRLPQPWADIPTPLGVQHALSLLEYSMVSGHDCLDVLMTLKPALVEPLYERLTESFQRQPPQFQQYYYHSWIKLRMALCRLSAGLGATGACLSLADILGGWLAALGATLRPEPELGALLDDQPLPDHDKLLAAFEAKSELATDSAVGAALRRPLQRVLDAAATALAAASNAPHQSHQPHGFTLWSDAAGLSLLRRSLAGVRLCGRGAAAEPLARTLARLAATLPAVKPDVVEECLSVSAQLPTRVWEALPRVALSAPHRQPWPHYLEYGVEPSALRYAPEAPPYATSDTPHDMDSIRYMYLSGWGWRRCARCGARALPVTATAPARHPAHPAQRAHDARYTPHCRCGGKWSFYLNV